MRLPPRWVPGGFFGAGRFKRRFTARTRCIGSCTLFTITAFLAPPAHVAEVYRAPELHAALFFALFMVTDPPTSPPKARDQVVFGAITAVVAYAAFEVIGAAYFLLAGVLAANVWEAWRKRGVRRARMVARLSSGMPL